MAGRKGRPKTGEGILTTRKIIAEALHLIDENGIEALTMRGLSGRLGVDSMAIYRYFPDKQSLLVGVVETVFSEFSMPLVDNLTWKEGVIAFAEAYRKFARSHPHLTTYLITTAGITTGSLLAVNEALYEVLLRAKIPISCIVQAADLIIDFIHGYVLAESTMQMESWDGRQQILEYLDQEAPSQFPQMRQIFQSLEAEDIRTNFEVELSIIIAGLEVLALGGGCNKIGSAATGNG